MSNESSLGSASPDSQSHSGVGQTANIGRATSVSSGAAKVFREFKWGLLTLFLLMVVVIGLVYDGGRKKKVAGGDKPATSDDMNLVSALDMGAEAGAPPIPAAPGAPIDQGNAPAVRGPAIETYSPPPLPPAPEMRPEPRVAITPAPAPVPTPTSTPAPGTAVTPPSQIPIAPAPPPPGMNSDKTYTVRSGDTLTSIAASMMTGKGSLKALLEANKDVLPNPNKLKVGMTLKIPSVSAPVETAAQTKPEAGSGKKLDAVPAPHAEGAASEYIVQSGDTLERIARKVFNDGRKWRDIYEWNRDQMPSASQLRVGQTLKMKAAGSSATTTVPTPSNPRVEEDVPAPKKLEKAPKAEVVKIKEEKEVDSPVFSSSSASIP